MKPRHAAALAFLSIVLISRTMVRSAYAQDARIGVVCGNVDDTAQGVGNVYFMFFDNEGSTKELRNFGFSLNANNFAEGPLEGSISSKRIEFKGYAGDHCKVTGHGTGENWALSGQFQFHGKCAPFFQGGTFSIPPEIQCIVFGPKPKHKEWQATQPSS